MGQEKVLYAINKGGGMMIDNQIMVFPKTFKEFADMFSIKDTDEVYSNGADFIPVFRVEQWLEHTMAIKALKQEPKTGHWIEEDMFDGDVAYRCSECDEPFCLIDGTPTDNMYNFCPNCGAKMESEKNQKTKTNGEVIKSLFPNIRLSYDICGNIGIYDGKENIIDNDWWDAPFKAKAVESGEIIMPNSIKCKIEHLCHNGTLTERERDRILKALDQEPMLDKIRSEIEQEQDDFMDDKDYDEGIRFGLMLAYQIIDKYKGESEE